MSGGSRSGRRASLRLVAGLDGRCGAAWDPATFLLFGAPRHGADGDAYPALDPGGSPWWLPGERGLGTWSAVTALAVRRAPGHARIEDLRRWRGPGGPAATLTDRRLVIHGAGDAAAHVPLERVRSARAVLGPIRGRVEVELLLHCSDTGTAARLTLVLVLRRRLARRLVAGLAAAQRDRWAAYELPAGVAAEVAAGRVRRSPRELRHDAVVHMPLGVTDAIRGPAAGPGVPQRMRAPLAGRQAAWADADSANAPASSS